MKSDAVPENEATHPASALVVLGGLLTPPSIIIAVDLFGAGREMHSLLAAAVAGGLIACTVIGVISALRGRQSRPLVAGAVLLIASVFVAGIALPALQRGRCGARSLRAMVALQELIGLQQSRIGDDLALHTPLALAVAEGAIDHEAFMASWCNARDAHDVRIGPYSLQDLWTGRASLEDLTLAASTTTMSAWEFVGPFAVSHEAAAYQSGRPDVVVGFEIFLVDEYDHGWNLATANGNVQPVSEGDDLAELLGADLAARCELGLDPPPEVGPIAIGMARLRAMEAEEDG